MCVNNKMATECPPGLHPGVTLRQMVFSFELLENPKLLQLYLPVDLLVKGNKCLRP